MRGAQHLGPGREGAGSMTMQLELLPMVLPATLNDVQWPNDHPLQDEWRALATSPVIVGEKLHGFDWMLAQDAQLKRKYLVSQMSHAEVVSRFNALGGASIKWDRDLQEYTTTTGDRF